MPEEEKKSNPPNPWLVFVGGPALAFLASYGGVQVSLAELRTELRISQENQRDLGNRLTQFSGIQDNLRVRAEDATRDQIRLIATLQGQMTANVAQIESLDRRVAERIDVLTRLMYQSAQSPSR